MAGEVVRRGSSKNRRQLISWLQPMAATQQFDFMACLSYDHYAQLKFMAATFNWLWNFNNSILMPSEDLQNCVRPTTRKFSFSNLHLLTACLGSEVRRIWFMVHVVEVTTGCYSTTITYITSSLCILQTAVRKKQKIKVPSGEMCHKSIVSCSYSLPKQMLWLSYRFWPEWPLESMQIQSPFQQL